MMFHAEQAGVLPDEQSGSRKDKSSNKLVLEKTLSFDIIRQQKIAATHTGLDASQCYDRMVHAPTGLSMIQHGGHEPAIRTMFEVLQNGEHKVATAYGVFTSTYGGRKRIKRGQHPIQAIGQGNGAGPAAFVMLSSTMINAMRSKGFGALYAA